MPTRCCYIKSTSRASKFFENTRVVSKVMEHQTSKFWEVLFSNDNLMQPGNLTPVCFGTRLGSPQKRAQGHKKLMGYQNGRFEVFWFSNGKLTRSRHFVCSCPTIFGACLGSSSFLLDDWLFQLDPCSSTKLWRIAFFAMVLWANPLRASIYNGVPLAADYRWGLLFLLVSAHLALLMTSAASTLW